MNAEQIAKDIAEQVSARGHAQWTVDAVELGFVFDGAGWYALKATDKDALKFRNKVSNLLRKAGLHVVGFSLPGQLRSKGGIGSGQPHIEVYTTCYGINVSGSRA